MPQVVELGRATATAGLEWAAGDLFGEWGLRADVFLLARVLHDWDDDPALRTLNRAREALAPGGRLFAIEMLRLTAKQPAAYVICTC